MQAKSDYYPFLDLYTIREFFIKKTTLPQDQYDMASYQAIFSMCEFSGKSIEGIPNRVFCRGTFIEMIIRVAKHLFCDIVLERDIDEMSDLKKEFSSITVPKAFEFFCEKYLQ